MKPPIVTFTRDQVESWTTSQTISVGASLVPLDLQPRLFRLAEEYRALEERASASRARRDPLIREFDRQFNAPGLSLNARASAIELALTRAKALKVAGSPQMVAARVIIEAGRGRTLKRRRIIEIIK